VSVAQSHIRQRLSFVVVAYGEIVPETELLGMVRLARCIYRRTSDLLHGRSSMVNLSPVLLEEWNELVVRLEDLPRRERPAACEIGWFVNHELGRVVQLSTRRPLSQEVYPQSPTGRKLGW